MYSGTLVIFPFLEDIKVSTPVIEKIIDTLDDDILFIDDRGDGLLMQLIESNPRIKYIRHEFPLGYGACFNTGYNYARDFGYEVIITMSPEIENYSDVISEMMGNITYGYDIVSCSRILENYDFIKIPEAFIQCTEILSSAVKEITGYDLTDPLSMIKAVKMKSLVNMELTEFSHAMLLQLWVQSWYYDLTIIEIPCESRDNFKKPYDDADNLDYYLTLLETEKYLFRRGAEN